ncbi:hypothetical protein FQN60_005994 [Etheostoma spectabile]|uniref:Uncharacterized protein n=1 Tax=Etheostoma spectabile TaxID=54343 RepID=A0A5J5CIN2_9PERO|nr:hypothetical protein FQN60_005994 [Etheostoma spectabile]
MKISGSLTLLLLLGSVSAQETSESNPPTPSDLYAALKEMTASLVQLKADMATGTVRISSHRVSTAAFLVKNSENVFAAHESQPAIS